MTDPELRRWELENNVVEDHLLYSFDSDKHLELMKTKPWTQDGKFFKSVWMSSVALMKMVIHARSGDRLEIMGLMQGKVVGDKFVIMDSFALPVVGTETRVNAGAEANTFMITYQEGSEQVSKPEPIVGWYHSHPGYGCWLSGIDCDTQKLYQNHQEPFVAVVIDPTRTCAAGKVEIKAFRCYPAGYTPFAQSTEDVFGVPTNKADDFGQHWREYYSLPISIFKSNVDDQILKLLWSAHWSATMLSNPLLDTTEYQMGIVQDLRNKVEALYERRVIRGRGLQRLAPDLKSLNKHSAMNAVEYLRLLSTLLLTQATLAPDSHNFQQIRADLLRRLEPCSDVNLICQSHH